ncbi:kelch-like protein 2 [Gorilla gorilla gorilla]|uniref:kelch-like protein 2 n=1 Tax=Gorilla gorilla gorilla TaxID=9595 RepID=UPI00300B7619
MKKAFKVMNELRSQNLLCDVTIVAEDMEISAHRVVLAACSPYFHAMFTGEMSESRAKRVRIKEVDGWTLRMLIDYVYTAEIQVTEENVQVVSEWNRGIRGWYPESWRTGVETLHTHLVRSL